MLSYRHAFHAGNFADVFKHSVLTQILSYVALKPKGYTYLDTHAGAGMYQLRSDQAKTTEEYLAGIAKLWQRNDVPHSLQVYIDYIAQLNANGHLLSYPGSPSIAQHLMRRQDAGFVYELHKADMVLLRQCLQGNRKFQVFNSDGYQAYKAHLPPATGRGVILIDPSYEIKTDYQASVQLMIDMYQRFKSGIIMLWYPVVDRRYITQMECQLVESSLSDVLQMELNMSADTQHYGMTGCGLFIVNPPWQLADNCEELLPYLVKHLSPNNGFYQINPLIRQ